MNIETTREDFVIVSPDTVAEAGLFQWLAARFGGEPVILEFDTKTKGVFDYYPHLWIKRHDPRT